MWNTLITDSTVNESTSDFITSVTAGAYNRIINLWQERKLVWQRKLCYGSQILQEQILLLDEKFDGAQKLFLAIYTCCTVSTTNNTSVILHEHKNQQQGSHRADHQPQPPLSEVSLTSKLIHLDLCTLLCEWSVPL